MKQVVEYTRKFFAFDGDRVLWGLVFGLVFFSLLAVFSATGSSKSLLTHSGHLALGLLGILAERRMHYKYFIGWAPFVCWVAFGLLLYVVIERPVEINGAARWVRIPLIGETFQPSEIAKIGLMMYVARVIAFEQEEGHCRDRALIKILAYALPLMGVIFFENFSTSALLLLVGLTVLFIGRLRWKTLLVLLLIVAACGTLFAWAIYNVPELEEIGRVDVIKSRLDGKNTYQADQSKIAIARGGLYGVGLGHSTQRHFLPEPAWDYIYAIIVEEYGLLFGGLPVLAIFLIILFRIGVIVRRCTRMFPGLLVCGLGLTIVYQALIHMLVCVGVGPVTGQPLPLVSKGGTSIFLTGIAIGMIQSIAYTFSEAGQREEKKQQERRRERLARKIEALECELETGDEDDDTLYY